MEIINEIYLNFSSTQKLTSAAQTGDILFPVMLVLVLCIGIAYSIIKKRSKIASLLSCILICIGISIPAFASSTNITVNVNEENGEYTIDSYQMNLDSKATLTNYKYDILDSAINDVNFEISINENIINNLPINIEKSSTVKIKILNLSPEKAKSLIGKTPIKLIFNLTLENQDSVISKDFDLGHNYKQTTYINSELIDYDIRKAKIEKEGYTIYDTNQYNDNLFATYTKDKNMYYLAYTPSNKEIREITCSNASLPPKQAEPYTKICDETVSIIKTVDNDHYGDSLGCIYRLEDGTFIIMDGGGKKEMDTTYECLKKLALNKEDIKIRMWYFSHPHPDHTGAFSKYAEDPSAYPNLSIDSFCYNFASNDEAYKYTKGNKRIYTELENTLKPFLAKTTFYKPLAGQVFHFPGANMDILYTFSDFCPTVMGAEDNDPETQAEAAKGKGDGNLESALIKITSISSKHVFMNTADIGDYNIRQIIKRYDKSILKSDILTIPHHGHDADTYRARNGNMEFYKLTDPVAIFVPMTKLNFAERSVAHKDKYYEKHHIISYERTQYICDKCKNHLYLSGENTYTLRMSDITEI